MSEFGDQLDDDGWLEDDDDALGGARRADIEGDGIVIPPRLSAGGLGGGSSRRPRESKGYEDYGGEFFSCGQSFRN